MSAAEASRDLQTRIEVCCEAPRTSFPLLVFLDDFRKFIDRLRGAKERKMRGWRGSFVRLQTSRSHLRELGLSPLLL